MAPARTFFRRIWKNTTGQLPSIDVARDSRKTAKTALAKWLAARQPVPLDEAEFEAICRVLSKSPDYVRKLLRESGVALNPFVEGVRQDSFDELARTLLALEKEYTEAGAQHDAERQRACRKLVIKAKDHARWSVQIPKIRAARLAAKHEMIAWMLVWLENPEVFPDWLRLRQRELAAANEPTAENAPPGN